MQFVTENVRILAVVKESSATFCNCSFFFVFFLTTGPQLYTEH